MSEYEANHENDELPGILPEDAGEGEMPVEEPRRAASLTLRNEDARENRAASMAVANDSLADALRITYRFIQAVMVLLVVFFLFSGFKTVGASEVGIKTFLGKISEKEGKEQVIPPSSTFSAPSPIGEMILVSTATSRIELKDEFVFLRTGDQRNQKLSELPAKSGDPRFTVGNDHYLITADKKIVHAEFSVNYRVVTDDDDAIAYVRNMPPDLAPYLVRKATQSAVIRVFAERTLDELIRSSSGDAATGSSGRQVLEQRIRELVQARLDSPTMQSGLSIETVTVSGLIPPLESKESFEKKTSAAQEASTGREQAITDSSIALSGVAGSASDPLIDLIRQYGIALENDENQLADELYEDINRVLLGDYNGTRVTIRGKLYPQVDISGQAATLISDARSARDTIVARYRQKAESFQAKLEAYRRQPEIFVTSEWTNAMEDFLDGTYTQFFFLDPDTESVIIELSSDPEVREKIERDQLMQTIGNNERIQELMQ
ncbi:MAG: SPFH domain-containing protein [Planctomycetota bacterium]